MDTTKLGAISGAIGAISSVIPGLLEKQIFQVAKVNFLDYAAVLTVGHEVINIWHWLIAVMGHIVFGAVLGIVYAFFIKKTCNESMLLKGAGYGALIWLFTLGIGSLYKLPHFKIIDPADCFFILVDAVIYGLATAFALQKFTQKSWS